MSNQQSMKIEAARAALFHVNDGMKLGIGTGSTAEEFVKLLAERIAGGLSVIGVPTSERTAALCEQLSVPLTTLEETPALDLTIDGADEVDDCLRLIKGGGGALLREKIVAYASKRMIVIADATKVVETLGQFPLPIEVNPFGLNATTLAVEAAADALSLSGELALRKTSDGATFITDGGHYILDASFGHISDPEALGEALHAIPGVVEHGMFIGLSDLALIATSDGVKEMQKQR